MNLAVFFYYSYDVLVCLSLLQWKHTTQLKKYCCMLFHFLMEKEVELHKIFSFLPFSVHTVTGRVKGHDLPKQRGYSWAAPVADRNGHFPSPSPSVVETLPQLQPSTAKEEEEELNFQQGSRSSFCPIYLAVSAEVIHSFSFPGVGHHCNCIGYVNSFVLRHLPLFRAQCLRRVFSFIFSSIFQGNICFTITVGSAASKVYSYTCCRGDDLLH